MASPRTHFEDLSSKLANQVQGHAMETGASQELVQVNGEQLKHQASVTVVVEGVKHAHDGPLIARIVPVQQAQQLDFTLGLQTERRLVLDNLDRNMCGVLLVESADNLTEGALADGLDHPKPVVQFLANLNMVVVVRMAVLVLRLSLSLLLLLVVFLKSDASETLDNSATLTRLHATRLDSTPYVVNILVGFQQLVCQLLHNVQLLGPAGITPSARSRRSSGGLPRFGGLSSPSRLACV